MMKFSFAPCAVAMLAVALASQAATQAAGAESAESCVQLISRSVSSVILAPKLQEFLKLVKRTLPSVPTNEWATLGSSQTQALEAAYPHAECEPLIDQVDELIGAAVAKNEECRKILADDESSIFALTLKDPVLAPVYETKEACFSFVH